MPSSAGNALALIKAVLELVADRRTGVLDVRSEGLRTQIYFDDGRPLFAEDEAPGESFGRLLMRQGVISNDQFVRVIDEMTRAAAGNNQLRFGEVAVALGILTGEQVERGLAEQVCGIIARSLQRAESQWTFEASPAAARPPRSFSLEVNPSVLEALGQSPDRSVVADVVAARPDELVLVAGVRPSAGADTRNDAGGGAGAETHAARLTAEQAFQKGIALLRDAKNASAAIELRRAADLQPESLEYLLYATWAKARSYREIPTEADRQALAEIAHKAKRRDPMFAFGSYVIGQLAMWEGDDASAKRWFYEALRLDRNSEAGKQVRILARRPGDGSFVGPLPTAPAPAPGAPPAPKTSAAPAPKTSAAPAPSASAAPAASASAAPAPSASAAPAASASTPPAPSASAPPVPAAVAPARPAPAGPPSKAPPAANEGAGRLAPAIAVLAALALVIFFVARKPAPRAGVAPGASPQPALAVDPTLPTPPTPPAPPVAADGKETPAPPEIAPPKAVGEKAGGEHDSDDAEMGTVVFPARAAGHRIFVDGRRAKTDGSEPLRLRCGAHVVQIGSSGSQESIRLPCGGELQLQ